MEHTSLHEWIDARAAREPGRVAVVHEGAALTYGQLVESAAHLAGRLRAAGAGPGALVGFCAERGTALVVGLVAILKTGAAYVPMDPGFPKDRLRAMVEDAAMPVILTERPLLDRLPEHQARVVLMDESGPGDATAPGFPAVAGGKEGASPAGEGAGLAYVIFTSGSTGRPKGVRIPHRAVVNFLNSMRREPGLTPDDVLLAVTTLSFDIAALELFLPLTTGARVVIASREVAADGFRLREELERSGATVMQATPVTWRMLLEAGWKGRPGFKALIGGEAVPRDLVNRLAPVCGSLWNMYGPTETTIWSTTGRLEAGEGPVSIGRPIDNTQVYLLDPERRPVPPGEVGELVIGGDGVAEGYQGRPDLTAERFLPDPFSGRPGARMYCTGDLARWLADGTLECLGRKDDQVKIRGYRIELGDVEAALLAATGVRQAAVAVRGKDAEGPRLVAYLVPREAGLEIKAVREQARERLPAYMVPSAWVLLEQLPLTPNGKLDRRALPDPGPGHEILGHETPYRGPDTDAERRWLGLWQQVLKVDRVGMDDRFFDLGGHSLLAVQLFTRIEREYGVRLPLTSLLQHPTPASLLPLLTGKMGDASTAWNSLVLMQPGEALPPLYAVHGAGGNVLLYRELVHELGPDLPFYGFQSLGLDGTTPPLQTVEAMAERYVSELLALQPVGPYHLVGYCMGGTVAYEMARRLRARGDRVALLALLDTYNFAARQRGTGWRPRLRRLWQKAGFHAGNLLRARGRDRVRYFETKLRRVAEDWSARRGGSKPGPRPDAGAGAPAIPADLGAIERTNHEAGMDYQPGPATVRLTVFKPERNYDVYPDPQMGWAPLAAEGLEIVPLPVNPHAMLAVPYVRILARELRGRLERAWKETEAGLPRPTTEARRHGVSG